MERRKLEEGRSPLTSSEDIHKRLVRPDPFHSQHSSSSAASPRCDESSDRNFSKLDLNSQLQQESNQVKKIKKLEDFLDRVLLSTIRTKIGPKRKKYRVEMEEIAKRDQKDSDWFEWPGDHHELMASSRSSRRSRSCRAKCEDEILDLKLDSDPTGTGPDETEKFYCTAFQLFERAAMKQFKP